MATWAEAFGVTIGAAVDVVVLALPYDAALAMAVRPVPARKMVVGIPNPITPDLAGLHFGHDTSATEDIAQSEHLNRIT